MEHKLDILKSINKVEAPDHLFSKIQSKVNQKEAPVLSINFFLRVAAVSLLLIAIDFAILNTANQEIDSIETSSLIYNNSHQLYNEK
tara:strand:+ start:254 stop:514 length:261 start_codon:yes stop_codon:yes gene_type:complete